MPRDKLMVGICNGHRVLINNDEWIASLSRPFTTKSSRWKPYQLTQANFILSPLKSVGFLSWSAFILLYHRCTYFESTITNLPFISPDCKGKLTSLLMPNFVTLWTRADIVLKEDSSTITKTKLGNVLKSIFYQLNFQKNQQKWPTKAIWNRICYLACLGENPMNYDV